MELLSASGDVPAVLDDVSAFRRVYVVDEQPGQPGGFAFGIHVEQAGNLVVSGGGVFLGGHHLVEDKSFDALVQMSDAHIADGLPVLSHGCLHGTVGVYHIGGLDDGAFFQRAFDKGFARAAAVFASVQGNGGVIATEFLPVGDLAVVNGNRPVPQ